MGYKTWYVIFAIDHFVSFAAPAFNPPTIPTYYDSREQVDHDTSLIPGARAIMVDELWVKEVLVGDKKVPVKTHVK